MGSGPGSFPVYLGRTALSADCKVAALVNEDGTIAIWDIQSKDVLQVIAGSRTGMMSGGIDSIAFSPDGKLLATGTREGVVEIWAVGGQTATAPATQPTTQEVGPPSLRRIAIQHGGSFDRPDGPVSIEVIDPAGSTRPAHERWHGRSELDHRYSCGFCTVYLTVFEDQRKQRLRTE